MLLKSGINTYQKNNYSLKYRFQRGQSDRANLLVIFSGFRTKGTLDFGGDAISPIRSNILWIFDEFGTENQNTYYLLEDGKFSPRDIIDDFINQVRQELGLNYENLTYSGFSKGGTAAIYYGLRHCVGAVVATVPQFFIGTYAKKYWPKVYDFMGSAEADQQKQQDDYDDIMPDCILSHSKSATHLYVFSSHADPQLSDEIRPVLPLLEMLPNFNLIVTDSPLITEHIDVTPYNIPALLALFQLTADGLYPTFGVSTTYQTQNQKAISSQRKRNEGVAVLEKCSTVPTTNQVELEMVTLLRGYEQKRYADLNRTLLVKSSDGKTTRIGMGKLIDKQISRRYVQDTFVDYQCALTVSPGKKGYPLSAFPMGQSECQVELVLPNGTKVNTALVTKRPLFFHQLQDGQLLTVKGSESGTSISRVDLKSLQPSEGAFLRVDIFSDEKGAGILTQGWFAPIGTTVTGWGDAHMYLVLRETKSESVFTFPLGLLDRGRELGSQINISKSMSKSYFSTLRAQAQSLNGLKDGDFVAQILFVNPDVTALSFEIGKVSIKGGKVLVKNNENSTKSKVS
ncbi:hypothetical protein BK816_00410 [Boudabousia tangfeifanii]|uniref:Uncharacterized protein n=1 Tax=Boudabousia tangfeifanii TaxID=1912795 RepID=A0A1D9MHZ6_9ACTO|nr:hypothetical protein [Boudabousia tangfeifanii]AOZ71941.1 hypothetical protein BK816_00410 [Boudabousia tangfeifanii]